MVWEAQQIAAIENAAASVTTIAPVRLVASR